MNGGVRGWIKGGGSTLDEGAIASLALAREAVSEAAAAAAAAAAAPVAPAETKAAGDGLGVQGRLHESPLDELPSTSSIAASPALIADAGAAAMGLL